MAGCTRGASKAPSSRHHRSLKGLLPDDLERRTLEGRVPCPVTPRRGPAYSRPHTSEMSLPGAPLDGSHRVVGPSRKMEPSGAPDVCLAFSTVVLDAD